MVHSTTSKLVLFCLFVFFSNIAIVNAQVVSTETGTVTFTSRVPLHDFSGTSNTLVGQIDFNLKTVDFYVDLATIKTGIGKRDKDMRISLDVDSYPFAEFFGTLDAEVDLSSTLPQIVTVTGKFTLHGVSNDVSISGQLQQDGNSWTLEAEWSLLLNDYGVVPPKLLIIKVDEKQEIAISAKLKSNSN